MNSKKQLGEKLSGRILASRWKVSVRHPLYREDGEFYMPLMRFPGALFDYNGYVIFPTKESYLSSPYLSHGERLHVKGGISTMPGYVRMRDEKPSDSN